MFLTICFALLIAACAAFAPKVPMRRSSALKASLQEMPGVGPETAGRVFDPLGLSEYAPIEFLREAELKHGRVCMVAFDGMIAPQTFGMLTESGTIHSAKWYEAMAECPVEVWWQFIGVCGIIEGCHYRHKMGMTDREYFWDPAGIAPKTDAAMKKKQNSELKNGRLAMLATAAFFSAHYIPGSVPGAPVV